MAPANTNMDMDIIDLLSLGEKGEIRVPFYTDENLAEGLGEEEPCEGSFIDEMEIKDL